MKQIYRQISGIDDFKKPTVNRNGDRTAIFLVISAKIFNCKLAAAYNVKIMFWNIVTIPNHKGNCKNNFFEVLDYCFDALTLLTI